MINFLADPPFSVEGWLTSAVKGEVGDSSSIASVSGLTPG